MSFPSISGYGGSMPRFFPGNPDSSDTSISNQAVTPAIQAVVPSQLSGDINIFTSAFFQVASFFTPPSNKFHMDPKSGTKYHMPAADQLFEEITNLFSDQDYKGFGINKKLSLPHPDKKNEVWCCDMVYYVKRPDQVDYQKKNFSWYCSFQTTTSAIESRITRQEQLRKKIGSILIQKQKKWNYDSWLFCQPQHLKKFSFSDEDIQETDVIVLFYKKLQKQSRSIALLSSSALSSATSSSYGIKSAEVATIEYQTQEEIRSENQEEQQ